MKSYVTAILLMVLVSGTAQATTAPEQKSVIKDFMKRLHQDPVNTLSTLPRHFDHLGRPLQQRRSGTPDVRTKDIYRQKLCPSAKPGEACDKSTADFQGLAELDPQNEPIRFFERTDYLKTLSDFDRPELKSHRLSIHPWSGDYWATYTTGIAKRYLDKDFPSARDLDSYFNFFKELQPIDYMDTQETDKLSPAEKYDLLMGDPRWGLTNWSLSQTPTAYKEDGTPHTWFGLCHGWAAAAFRAPRPKNLITFTSPNFRLRFFPDDLKALSTLLWAQAPVASKFLGGRCNDEKPEMDENGRTKSTACFDVNPGAWHMVLVNRLALEDKSFVLDATYDHEVWNQPVLSFEAVYFNPETQATEGSLSDLAIPLSDYASDVFKDYRSPKTKKIIGVMLELEYLVETHSSGYIEDHPGRDRSQRVRYFYDLELDEKDQIIGGEWHHNVHPDFVWAPYDHLEAITYWDQHLTEEWSAHDSVPPSSWQKVAPFASRQGLPLAKAVQALLGKASM